MSSSFLHLHHTWSAIYICIAIKRHIQQNITTLKLKIGEPADDWRMNGWMNEWICGRAPRSKMKHKKLTDCYLDIFNSEYASCHDASAYILSALFSLFEEMKEFYVIFFVLLFEGVRACVCVSYYCWRCCIFAAAVVAVVAIISVIALSEWIICLLCTTINYLFVFRLLLPQIVAAMFSDSFDFHLLWCFDIGTIVILSFLRGHWWWKKNKEEN